jgi:rhamnogalacturonan endolyase
MTMKISRRAALVAASAASFTAPALARAQTAGAVTVSEDADSFTLSNGLITAKVSKKNGDITSMVFKGTEVLYGGADAGHPFGYWSHDVVRAQKIDTKITIDPRTNGGQRAEVSVKGWSNGKVKLGSGPGVGSDGDVYADIDIRYHLGRGETGVHTYCIFDHPADYPGWTMSEARFAAKLQPWLDHVHVDKLRSGPFPLLKGDKYVYSGNQYDNRAYGFTSPAKRVGAFFLLTSHEYLSGGPTKPELYAHGEKPTVLAYWRSSHYTGANVSAKQGEPWTRVVGPLMIYANEGATHEAMVADAKAKLKAEEAQWPYAWVKAPGYANKAERATVTGQLVLSEPLAPAGAGIKGRMFVGLSKAPYLIDTATGSRVIGWQNEGSWYQFWVDTTDRTGRFSIPNVVPGTYTLHAFADGVLGEYMRRDVTVRPGQRLDLGRLTWTPVRRGRQIWEIGTPNRTATEFFYGDRFFLTALAEEYPKLFPNDVTFRIGQSDPAKDWFFQHTPHLEAGQASGYRDFFGYSGRGRATPYRILFTLPKAGKGRATLRIATSGTGSATTLGVTVNGKPAGSLPLPGDGVMTRHQISARWYEFEVPFDAALLQAGENSLVITVPEGSLNSGVIYDYLRLELDESATA